MSRFMRLNHNAESPILSGDNRFMDVEQLDLSADGVAEAVLELQRSAYRIEADLIESDDIPPLHETLGDLIEAPVAWLGIRKGGDLVAALAYSSNGQTIDIDRLVVSPKMMRRGLGSALLRALPSGRRTSVSTGSRNEPAHRFYIAHGFVPVGETEPVPGLRVSHFERAADGS
jgi:GNAT superfamily N-acetyltransferase